MDKTICGGIEMNCFKAFAEGFMAKIRVQSLSFISSKTISIQGEIHVLNICTDALSILGVPSDIPGACVKVTPSGECHIFVNEKFFSLSDETQKGIIAHEIGHIKLGHLKLPKRKLLWVMISRNFKKCPMEYDADFVGASIVGKDSFIESLKELRSFCVKYKSTQREISKRIDALMA